MTLAEPLAVTLLVVEALEGLGVRYVVGGSLASSVHGVFRASVDAVHPKGRAFDAAQL